jgi:hypothetical protein
MGDEQIIPFVHRASATVPLDDGSRILLFPGGSRKRVPPDDEYGQMKRYLYDTGPSRNIFRVSADNQVLWRIPAHGQIKPHIIDDAFVTIGWEDGKLKACTGYCLEYEINTATGELTFIAQVGIWNIKSYDQPKASQS